MNEKRVNRVMLISAAAIVTLAAAVAVVCILGGTSFRLGTLPDPAETVSEYFECYGSGRFERMDELTYGYESIGLEDITKEEPDATLYGYAAQSIKCEIAQCLPETKMTATCVAKITYFDAGLAAEDIKARTADEVVSLIKQSEESGEAITSADEEYYDVIVKPALVNAAGAVLTGDSYLKTEDIKLNLVYADRHWQVILDDDIEAILMCGLE